MMRGKAQAQEWATLFARVGFTLARATAQTAHHKLDQERQKRGAYGQLSGSDEHALSTVVRQADKQQDDAEEIVSELHLRSSSPPPSM